MGLTIFYVSVALAYNMAFSESIETNIIKEVTMTSNQLRLAEVVESRRSNLAKEAEAERSNRAKEAENVRSNLAKETETHRSNVRYEGIESRKVAETERSNLEKERMERIKQFGGAGEPGVDAPNEFKIEDIASFRDAVTNSSLDDETKRVMLAEIDKWIDSLAPEEKKTIEETKLNHNIHIDNSTNIKDWLEALGKVAAGFGIGLGAGQAFRISGSGHLKTRKYKE